MVMISYSSVISWIKLSIIMANAYLAGAFELRNGPPPIPLGVNTNFFAAMTAEQIFDVIGVRFTPSGPDTATRSWPS